MSASDLPKDKNVSYVLVPATVVENEETSKGKKSNQRNYRLPYGAKAVEGGYILNGTLYHTVINYDYSYTDFSSEMGKKMIKNSILPKLEFVFSEKYLSYDQFLRSYMDVEGFFPVSLLLYIPVIQSFGVDSAFLIDILADSTFAEVDKTRMTIRPKQNWEKWILPNPNGGMGVPRYAMIEEVVPLN